jgi:hypothetical protein
MKNFTQEEVGFLIVAFGQFCDGGFTKEGWAKMRAIQKKLADWHESLLTPAPADQVQAAEPNRSAAKGATCTNI